MRVTKKPSENITIVVSSCDAYSDLWYAFFKILKNEWPTVELPIVLNTETKTFSFEGLNITTFQLCKNRQMEWGGRLKETLKLITTDYILFMLDDFFLYDKVNERKLYELYEIMEKDRSISVFEFKNTSGKNLSCEYSDFEQRPRVGEYKFNCQIAIWRRKDLIKYLRVFESPWEWETKGNKRSYRYINKKFYSLKKEAEQIFPYLYYRNDYSWGGAVIWGGKWFKSFAEPILKSNGIEMDFSIRGCLDENKIFIEKNTIDSKDNRPVFVVVLARTKRFIVRFIGCLKDIRHYI